MSTSAEAARERLADRLLPGGERSWIDLAVDAARTTIRGRHGWWAALRREGYSYPEIAAGVGADVSTVIAALKKLGARDRHEGPPVGFAGMGLGAGI